MKNVKRVGLKKRTVVTLSESRGQVLINTGQNPNKIGRLSLDNFQNKEDYHALVQETNDGRYPRIYVSKGRTQHVSKPGIHVLIFKASSPKSAQSIAKKEARKRYLKHFNYSETTSNIFIDVQSDISENIKTKEQRKLAREAKRNLCKEPIQQKRQASFKKSYSLVTR